MNKSLAVTAFALTTAATLVGCTTEQPAREDRSDADVLAAENEAKEDGFSRCGTECGQALCGASWSVPAAALAYTCGTDDDAAAYLDISLSGSESQRVNTRDFVYQPVFRLDRVYMYGLEIWDFATRTGFELNFRDITKGSFVVGGPHDKGVEYNIYTPDFQGPGEYVAEFGIMMSSRKDSLTAERVVGNRYYTKDGCKLTVATNEAASGGFKGTFACASVPAKEGAGRIAVSGEFLIPASAVDQTAIIAKP